MNTSPTLEDVARRAGVSTATVSRCLNFPDQVRAATRARVQSAIDALGYTPHFGGRALASNRTNTVGAVIPTMNNAIFAQALQVMQEELSAAGVTLLVATSQYDDDREREQLRTLLARGVDGLVLIGRRRPEETYAMLRARGIPFVVLWSYDEDGTDCCVGFDNVAAARAMAERVLAEGHRRIAMIAGITRGNDRAEARVAGVRAALGAAGIALVPPRLVEAPYDIDESAAAAEALLALEPRPTAIICGNDVQAAGALRAARRLGLAVPGDLSVVGFDDIDLATVVDPPLTTVRVPHRRMGRAAAQCLLDRLRLGEPMRSRRFDAALVERESLGPPPGADAQSSGAATK